MDFKDISYSIAVVEHQSISQAARSLYISQPALSQSIRKTELELGKPLFHRIGRAMTPTAACQMIVASGRKLLLEREMLLNTIAHLQDEPHEVLRLGMSSFYCRHLLPGILQHFQQHFPNVQLDVAEVKSYELERRVADGQLDFCVLPVYPMHPELEYTPVGVENIYLCMHRSHPLNQLAEPNHTINIQYTREEGFVLQNSVAKAHSLQERLFAYAGFKPHIIYESSTWEVAIAFVISGIGISLLPDFMLGDQPEEERPCYYRIQNIDTTRPFGLGYRHGAVLSPAAEELVKVIRSEFSRLQSRVPAV